MNCPGNCDETAAGGAVSIALCTFNGERFLAQQLESLAAQTRRPDEVILCDDGSTDRTLTVAEETACRLGLPCQIIRNESTLGYSANFEQATRLCSGEFIFFCDQDDVWQREKIARCLEVYRQNPRAVLVASDSEMVDQELRPLHCTYLNKFHFRGRLRRKLKVDPFVVMLALRPFPGHAISIRSCLRELILPVPARWTYDTWASAIASAVGDVVLLDQCLVLYRRHERQVVGTFDTSPFQLAKSLGAGASTPYREEIEKFGDLKARLEDFDRKNLPAMTDRLRQLDGKIQFLQARVQMKELRFKRWLLIARQFFRGHYFDYGQGWLSVGRDLLGK